MKTTTMRRMCCVLVAALLCAGAMAAEPKKKTAVREKAPPPFPSELAGTVSRVVDGDTLWLKLATEAEPAVIRIEGIDAPETCQPGGAEATARLNELALNRNVTIKVSAKDDYGRFVGKVFDGETDVGDRMVRDGLAWSLRYKYDRGPYMAEERMAIALKRGVHASGEAIQPREFRQRNGLCAGEAAAAPAAVPAVPAAPGAARPATTAATPIGGARRCDGRVYCSQMTSCEEAKWFLQNCPGVKMDGNRDGVPCEQQWCKAR